MKINEILTEKRDPNDVWDDMMDDLSVQTLLQDILRANKKGMSLEDIDDNFKKFEKEAGVELTQEERDALFFNLPGYVD